MALSLFTDIPDTCYTSRLQELHVLTSASHINFYVYWQAYIYYSSNGRTLIFETEYYTHHSRANVYDLGTLIETYMQQNSLSIKQFIISAYDGTNSEELTLKVLYCKQTPTIEAATLLADHVLTTSLTRLTYPDAKELLPYFAGFGSQDSYVTHTVHYFGTYLNPDGTTGTCQHDLFGRTGYGLQTIREFLTLPTAQTTKTATKSSTAVCGDTQTQNDITHSRTYEEQQLVVAGRAEAPTT